MSRVVQTGKGAQHRESELIMIWIIELSGIALLVYLFGWVGLGVYALIWALLLYVAWIMIVTSGD